MSNFLINKVEGDTLQPLEWNQLAELNNLITSSGQSLDANVLEQIAKAIANYVNSGNFYTENGVANSYTLIGAGSFKTPTAYINGMVVRFITTNANTTTTPIVNLAGLGAKNIKKADGTAVIAGDINGYVELRYNGTDFLLSPLSSALNITTTNKGLTYLNKPITIANNSVDADNDIDFTAGNFQFADGSGQAVLSAMTKRLDASWTAGTNQGGLFSGTKANNTWYHLYAIENLTSGVVDAGYDISPTTPSLPAGYTKRSKALFAVKTDSNGNILRGTWLNDRSFYFKDDILEEQNGITTGSLVLVGVPLLQLKAIMKARVGAGVVGAETAPPAVPIKPRRAPTATVVSTATSIARSVPATGEGISVSTLSVETSSSASSTATESPTFFNQRVTVPSETLSPSAGIVMTVPAPVGAGAAGATGAGGATASGTTTGATG